GGGGGPDGGARGGGPPLPSRSRRPRADRRARAPRGRQSSSSAWASPCTSGGGTRPAARSERLYLVGSGRKRQRAGRAFHTVGLSSGEQPAAGDRDRSADQEAPGLQGVGAGVRDADPSRARNPRRGRWRPVHDAKATVDEVGAVLSPRQAH